MIHAVYLAEWFYGAAPPNRSWPSWTPPTYAARRPQVEDLALAQIAFPGGYAALHHGWGAGVWRRGTSVAAMATSACDTRWARPAGSIRPPKSSASATGKRSEHKTDDLVDQAANNRAFIHPAVVAVCRRSAHGTPAAGQRSCGARALEGRVGAHISLVSPEESSACRSRRTIQFSARESPGLTHSEVWQHSRTLRSGIFGLRDRA